MTVESKRLAFTLSIPDLEIDCPICFEPLPVIAKASSELSMQHEGPDGEKHQAIHAGCLRSWLEKSDLCMHCNEPLDQEQLCLFLEELETLDFSSLSPKQLKRLAIESGQKEDLKTARTKLKKAIKALESALLELTPLATRYCHLIEEILRHVEEKKEAKTEQEYYQANESLTQLIKSRLMPVKENYVDASLEFEQKSEEYGECYRIYQAHEKSRTSSDLQGLKQPSARLKKPSETSLEGQIHKLKASEKLQYETAQKIQKLEMDLCPSYQTNENTKLYILFTGFMLFYLYKQMAKCQERAHPYSDSPSIQDFSRLIDCLTLSIFLASIPILISDFPINYLETNSRLTDFFICKIKIPQQNAYQRLKTFSDLIQEES
jgi:hypothetical protein